MVYRTLSITLQIQSAQSLPYTHFYMLWRVHDLYTQSPSLLPLSSGWVWSKKGTVSRLLGARRTEFKITLPFFFITSNVLAMTIFLYWWPLLGLGSSYILGTRYLHPCCCCYYLVPHNPLSALLDFCTC